MRDKFILKATLVLLIGAVVLLILRSIFHPDVEGIATNVVIILTLALMAHTERRWRG